MCWYVLERYVYCITNRSHLTKEFQKESLSMGKCSTYMNFQDTPQAILQLFCFYGLSFYLEVPNPLIEVEHWLQLILLPRCELLGLNEIFWISSGVSTLLLKKVISWKLIKWLGLHTFTAVIHVQFLVGELNPANSSVWAEKKS